MKWGMCWRFLSVRPNTGFPSVMCQLSLLWGNILRISMKVCNYIGHMLSMSVLIWGCPIHTQQWDLDILNDLFIDKDIHLIQNIPLSSRPINDILIWKWHKKGVYTVKSGYKTLSSERRFPLISTRLLCGSGTSPSPKVKVFFWKVCTHCLPIVDM